MRTGEELRGLRAGENRVGRVKAAELPPQEGQAPVHGVSSRQPGRHAAQVPGHTRRGGRWAARAPKPWTGTPGQEVPHPLGRGADTARRPCWKAGRSISRWHSAPRPGGRVGAEIPGRDGDQQGGVGICAVPGAVAHAVGDHAALLRGGGHHLCRRGTCRRCRPPRPLARWHGQLVVRRAQRWVPGAVRRTGRGRSSGLPGARCGRPTEKALALHGQAQAVQLLEGVPGAVANGENHLASTPGPAPRRWCAA